MSPPAARGRESRAARPARRAWPAPRPIAAPPRAGGPRRARAARRRRDRASSIAPRPPPAPQARRSLHRSRRLPAAAARPAGATVASLALGRFVFLPYHRRSLAKAGKPVQNGTTHYDAGDRLAEEVTFFTATNDPAGFSLIDVMAWGAIGHALGYYVLATSSLAALSRAPLPY